MFCIKKKKKKLDDYFFNGEPKKLKLSMKLYIIIIKI